MALLAQSVAILHLRLFSSLALHPWESQESSTKGSVELLAPVRHRGFLPCQDSSCATRCRFVPTSRSRRGASFCVRQNSRTHPSTRNNVRRAIPALCALHPHISRPLLHAPC